MKDSISPDLEERFSPPPKWRWGQVTRDGYKLRYGAAFPDHGKAPDAVVVILPGLHEFGEKYFELARDLLDHNLAIWIIDWRGQGKATRYFAEHPHKRHALNFALDVEDLHALYEDYIKPSSVHTDVGRLRCVMLGHSMGANIGLRYLRQYPDDFSCAAFTAPMFSIAALRPWPSMLAYLAARLMPSSTMPPGEHNTWTPSLSETEGPRALSHDENRNGIYNSWCLKNPELQTGCVTWGWLRAAISSCGLIKKSSFLKTIQTHCLIALAEWDVFVNNDINAKIAKKLPHADLIELAESGHEILMEKDDIRMRFLDAFYAMIKEHIIDNQEGLKTF